MSPRKTNEIVDFENDLFNQIIEDEDDTETVDDEENLEATVDDDTNDDDNNSDDQTVEDDDNDDDDDFDPKQRLPEDKDGNLLQDGKVAIKAGKERGIFEKLKTKLTKTEQLNANFARQMHEVANASRNLLDKYNELREKSSYYERVGLNETELKTAIDIFARTKTDPKGAIKQILTMMHMNGIDLSDMGVTGPLDAKTVAQHVLDLQRQQEKATKPVEDTSPQETADKEARMFIQNNPDILQFDNGINLVADVKQRFPQMSLETIWFKIKEAHAKQQQQQRKQPPPRMTAKNPPRDLERPKKRTLDNSPRPYKMSVEQIGKELLRDLKNFGE